MSFLKESWQNFATPLWEREAVQKMDEHVRLENDGVPIDPVPDPHPQYTFGPTVVLLGTSVVTQTPAGLSIPLDVNFGPAQNTLADTVMLDAGGLITFNQGGRYTITTNLYLARTSNPGVSYMLTRGLIDGVQFGNPIVTELPDLNSTFFEQLLLGGIVPAGTTLQIQIMRDAQGSDNGSLEVLSTEWGDTPSALVRVYGY